MNAPGTDNSDLPSLSSITPIRILLVCVIISGSLFAVVYTRGPLLGPSGSYLNILDISFVQSQRSALSTAGTIAQILATILAIGISLSLLSIEYSSNRFTYWLASRSLFSLTPIVLFGSYLLEILFAILLSAYPNLLNRFTYSVLIAGFVWCILNLATYLVYIARILDSSIPLDIVKTQTPDTYTDAYSLITNQNKSDPSDQANIFVNIERVITKSITSGDIEQFLTWLDVLENVEKRYTSGLEGSSDEDGVDEKMTTVLRHFLSMRKLIFHSALNGGNEYFAAPLARYEATRIEKLLGSQYRDLTRDSLAQFHTIGRGLANNEFQSALDRYIEIFRDVVESQIESVSSSDSDDGEQQDHQGHPLDLILQGQFETLVELVEVASAKGFESATNSALGTFHYIVVKSWENISDDFIRDRIIYTCRVKHRSAYQKAIENGMEGDPFGNFRGLSVTLLETDDREMRRSVIKHYASLVLASIREENYTEIFSMSVGLSPLENRGDYEQIADLMAEMLDDDEVNDEARGYIVTQMLSIREQADKQGIDIADRVNEPISDQGFSTEYTGKPWEPTSMKPEKSYFSKIKELITYFGYDKIYKDGNS